MRSRTTAMVVLLTALAPAMFAACSSQPDPITVPTPDALTRIRDGRNLASRWAPSAHAEHGDRNGREALSRG